MLLVSPLSLVVGIQNGWREPISASEVGIAPSQDGPHRRAYRRPPPECPGELSRGRHAVLGDQGQDLQVMTLEGEPGQGVRGRTTSRPRSRPGAGSLPHGWTDLQSRQTGCQTNRSWSPCRLGGWHRPMRHAGSPSIADHIMRIGGGRPKATTLRALCNCLSFLILDKRASCDYLYAIMLGAVAQW